MCSCLFVLSKKFHKTWIIYHQESTCVCYHHNKKLAWMTLKQIFRKKDYKLSLILPNKLYHLIFLSRLTKLTRSLSKCQYFSNFLYKSILFCQTYLILLDVSFIIKYIVISSIKYWHFSTNSTRNILLHFKFRTHLFEPAFL